MRHLDTNIVIALLNGNVVIATRFRATLPKVAISSLVLAELIYGARASTRPGDHEARIQDLLQVVPVVDFDRAAALAYGQPRADLRRKGRPTGQVDALIAAVALASGAILVTHNTRHFEHIEGLQLSGWPGLRFTSHAHACEQQSTVTAADRLEDRGWACLTIRVAARK